MHYESYWGLKVSPFENVPDSKFYFPSQKHEEGFQRLVYGVEARKGSVLLTGEVGCGKTTLSRLFVLHLAQEQYDIALIANPSMDEQNFQGEILYQFGVKAVGNKLDQLHQLNEHLLDNFRRGKESVLIIDEAQTIKDDVVFEELRLLLNFQLNDRFLITLILLGQPELNARINAIEPFAQRVATRFHLPAFDLEETIRYMEFRLKLAGVGERQIFSRAAVALLFMNSKGVPRVINTLADLSLLSGFLEKKPQVDVDIVTRVIGDFALGGQARAAH